MFCFFFAAPMLVNAVMKRPLSAKSSQIDITAVLLTAIPYGKWYAVRLGHSPAAAHLLVHIEHLLQLFRQCLRRAGQAEATAILHCFVLILT
jgi:hypothetical protein